MFFSFLSLNERFRAYLSLMIHNSNNLFIAILEFKEKTSHITFDKEFFSKLAINPGK